MQNSKANPFEIFEYVEYEPKYFDIVLDLLTKSYMLGAPFVKQLGLTEEFMRQEFRTQLETNYYSHGILAKHKQTLEIAACLFWDAFEKFDWKEVDISQIPSNADVRRYMRYATIQPFYQEISKNPSEYAYTGNTAVNAKFMGYGIGPLLNYYAGFDIQRFGFKKIVSNAINQFSQGMLDNKPFAKPIIEIYCENIALKSGEKPFQGSGFTYKSYWSDIEIGGEYYFRRFGKKLELPKGQIYKNMPRL